MAYTDRFPIVNNFLETRLSADCDEGETTLYLERVDALPRIIVGRDYIPLVLRDAGSVREVVYVDSVDTDSGAIVVKRGQEGTNAAAWSSGSYVYCTVTADSFQRMRVNGFAPLVAYTGRPSITRTSATTANITGDFTAQIEVGMAVRILSGETVVEPTDAEIGAIHITGVSFASGVTSVSFQNVSLPVDVSGLDLGLSVASAPLYHPDMIVADNDTLSQEGNVISAKPLDASLRALIAEEVADAENASSQEISAQISGLDSALRAFIAKEVAKCLKTGGGTMSGPIVTNVTDFVRRDVNNSFLALWGGSDWQRCSLLTLYGGDNGGSVRIGANNGTNGSEFLLSPGRATINGHEIMTYAHGFPLNAYSIYSFVSSSTYTVPSGGSWIVCWWRITGDSNVGWAGSYPGGTVLTVGDSSTAGFAIRYA